MEKRFAKDTEFVPLQLALRRHPGGPAAEGLSSRSPAAALPPLQPGDRALFLGRAHYGALATVLPNASAGLDADGKPVASPGAYMECTTCT